MRGREKCSCKWQFSDFYRLEESDNFSWIIVPQIQYFQAQRRLTGVIALLYITNRLWWPHDILCSHPLTACQRLWKEDWTFSLVHNPSGIHISYGDDDNDDDWLENSKKLSNLTTPYYWRDNSKLRTIYLITVCALIKNGWISIDNREGLTLNALVFYNYDSYSVCCCCMHRKTE